MKKTAPIFFATLIFLSVLSGCQKTPDSPFVVQKNNELMLEKAKETPQNDLSLTASHFTTEFSGAGGKLTVLVDADITVPQGGSIPILRVKRAGFSQEQATAIQNALAKGELLQCREDGFLYAKGEIEKHILKLKAAARQAGGEPAPSSYPAKEIAYYERLLRDAPEQPRPISGRLEPATFKRMDAERVFDAEAEDVEALYGMSVGNGCYETLEIRNEADGLCRVRYVREPNASVAIGAMVGTYITREEAYDPQKDAADPLKKDAAFLTLGEIEKIADVSFGEAEARAAANALMGQLGIDYASCIIAEKVYGGSYDPEAKLFGLANPLRCVWRLRYGRAAGGLVATHTAESGANLGGDIDSATIPWTYEAITVYLDDSGVVGFEWLSPYEMLKEEVENAAVLSFGDIQSILEKMLPVKYSYYGNFDARATMFITEIRFGLARISAQDEHNVGLMVPVWDFFGYMEIQETGKDFIERSVYPNQSLLTINAVDGSIIDRNLGY